MTGREIADRRRPVRHFTPRAGWLNDPHGVVHADGRYHLFFQHNPAGPSWDAAVAWGHATSADLLTWAEQPVALTPGAGELGCWSGSVVLSDRGVPALFYTRVTAADTATGRIVRALGDPALRRWRRDPPEPVVSAPPGMREFRDPYVWRASDGWRMLVGAGLADGSAAVLQYRSDDLTTWGYDGIAAAGPGEGMWECPQFFPLGGAWVLIVSVPGDGVRYAVGDYDGTSFTAQARGRFGHGPAVYATTTFTDADGRRCALSWLREPAGATPSAWSGALSVPWVLRLAGDRLTAGLHPHLPGDAVLNVDGPGVVDLGGAEAVVDADAVVVRAGGAELLRMPGGAAARFVVDAGIAEVTVDGVSGVGAARWAA